MHVGGLFSLFLLCEFVGSCIRGSVHTRLSLRIPRTGNARTCGVRRVADCPPTAMGVPGYVANVDLELAGESDVSSISIT